MQTRPALDALDHLLLGARDLDQGMAWLEATTGIRAEIGGVHPGRGTRNALASLGGRQYLEVIAPDPAQSTFEFHLDIRRLAEPRLVTWAATGDVEHVAAAAARAPGLRVAGPRDGSRRTTGGSLLRWRTVAVDAGLSDGSVEPLPFFIQWAADSRHPSADAPEGLRLVALELQHPDPGRLESALATVGIETDVEPGAAPRLTATLDTPKGRVRL